MVGPIPHFHLLSDSLLNVCLDTARKTIVGSYGSKLTAIAVAMLSGDDRTISADTLATLLIKDEDGGCYL